MEYSYDTASRLLSLDNSTGSGHHLYEYAYDKVGNRTSMAVTDSGGTKMHLYGYDKTYQVTEVNYPVGYEYLATDTTFNYDGVGNRTSVIDTGGTTSYTTNALNQYTAVGGVNYTYDDNGNLTYDGANAYSYDPENRLTTVEKVPDPLSSACDINLAFTSGGDADWFNQSAEYSYGNDAAQSGDIGDGESTWLQTTVTGPGYLRFAWKLSAEVGDEMAVFIDGSYGMGRSGNFDWQESGAIQITGSGTHTIRWRYSKDGSGSSGSDCLWIDNVRWTGAMPDSEGWDEIEYVYDLSGRRIEKKVDGTTTLKFLYDGDHILAEYDANDTLLRKYVHGPCIDEPICMIESSGTYAGTQYYHYDALGSVVALTDPNGDVVQLYEYSVYGQVAASDANHPNRFMFTGREFDKDTGLYYYRARYYNPEIGRFLQTDPIGYGDGMNWYAYCRNSPISSVDPSGLTVLAFYDGAYEVFREAGDDDYFTYSFDISNISNGMNATEYIIWLINNPSEWASEATYRSVASYVEDTGEITDLYFYGEGHSNGGGDVSMDLSGVQLSAHADRTPSTFTETFFTDLGDALDNNNGSNARIHLRGCDSGKAYAAYDGVRPLIDLAARKSGHTVTGCETTIEFNGWADWMPSILRGPYEINYGGPDYTLQGKLVKAVPNPNGIDFVRYYTVWYPGKTEWVEIPINPAFPGGQGTTWIQVLVPQPY